MICEGWAAFPAGIMISTVVTSMGIGGGILWMPFFLIILKLEPETAVLTSFIIQIFGKGSGSITYLRQKKVDIKLAGSLLMVALPGIALGSFIAGKLQSSFIEFLLGILLLITAFLFVSSNQKYDEDGLVRVKFKRSYKYLWLTVPMSVGSGLLSTGLGEWLIPVMRARLSLKMGNAIATCIFLTLGIIVAGTLFHLAAGRMADLEIILWAVPGVIIGGQVGPHLLSRIDERRLKEIFIFLLTLIGIHLIYNAF